MPLLDHFHHPLNRPRHWEGLLSAWASALCRQLNGGLLPSRYFAEPHVHSGGRIEVDVATFEEVEPFGRAAEGGGVAVWAPPRPTTVLDLDFGAADVFEVRVSTDQEGPQLVAAIEIVSPANKGRPSHRRAFATKCGSYLHEGVGLVIADVVTERSGSLHADLLELLGEAREVASDLYAGAYRAVSGPKATRLECWLETLAIGARLPTLPLWIAPDLALPLDLENAYQAACAALRIA